MKTANTVINIFLLLAYGALNYYLITCHINWRDEAQSWLLARDLSIPGLIRQMSYEGHPCMWHLFLMPLAKLGFPYESMNILSLVFMSFAAELLLWRSPFPLIVKIAILFSNSFVFFLPVVSRSYCLIPPIICLLAVTYPKRHDRPFLFGFLIALLVQTHVIMLGMAAALSFFWLGEALVTYHKKREGLWLLKQAGGLTLPLLSLLFLLVQLMNVTEASAFNLPYYTVMDFLHLLKRNCISIQLVLPLWLTKIVYSIVVFAAAVLSFCLLRNKKAEGMKPIFIGFLGIIFHISFLTLMYGISDQRYIAIHFMGLWSVWAAWEHISSRMVRITAAVSLCVFFFSGWIFYYSSQYRDALTGSLPYSDAQACAEYIRENIPEDAIILTPNEPYASALLPYCERDCFYSTNTGEKFSYVTWKDTDPVITTSINLRNWAKEYCPDSKELYFIFQSDYPHSDSNAANYQHLLLPDSRLMYATPVHIYTGDSYQIYCVPLQE